MVIYVCHFAGCAHPDNSNECIENGNFHYDDCWAKECVVDGSGAGLYIRMAQTGSSKLLFLNPCIPGDLGKCCLVE